MTISAPTVEPEYITQIGEHFLAVEFTGSYVAIVPLSIEYRILIGEEVLLDWTAVASFGGGSYSFTPIIPANQDIKFEIRADGGLESDESDAFGILVAASNQGPSTDAVDPSVKSSVESML